MLKSKGYIAPTSWTVWDVQRNIEGASIRKGVNKSEEKC